MTVFRPFDIHRTTIVLLNLHRLFRQLLHFFVGERENVALFLRHILNLHLLAVLLGGGVNHADFFRPHGAAYDGRTACRQGWLMDIKFIRVNRALHHHFTQSPCRGDKDHLVKAGFGIDREHHP